MWGEQAQQLQRTTGTNAEARDKSVRRQAGGSSSSWGSPSNWDAPRAAPTCSLKNKHTAAVTAAAVVLLLLPRCCCCGCCCCQDCSIKPAHTHYKALSLDELASLCCCSEGRKAGAIAKEQNCPPRCTSQMRCCCTIKNRLHGSYETLISLISVRRPVLVCVAIQSIHSIHPSAVP